MKTYASYLLAMFFATTCLVGCKSMPFDAPTMPNMDALKAPFSSKPDKDEPQFAVPTKMTVAWKGAILERANQPAIKGIGGRVFFFDAEEKPCRAEGKLVIYGYEDGKETASVEADVKFVFRQEDLQKHHSDSELGPSYSVWCPWGEYGGPRQGVSLIAIFETTDGTRIKAGQTLTNLPGTTPPEKTVGKGIALRNFEGLEDRIPKKNLTEPTMVRHADGSYQVQNDARSQVATVSHESTAANNTTTITVPRPMANRMKELPKQDLGKIVDNYSKKTAEAKRLLDEMRAKRPVRKKPSPKTDQAVDDQPNADRANGDAAGRKGSFGAQTDHAKFPSQMPVFGLPGPIK